jgi:hypothetical protein
MGVLRKKKLKPIVIQKYFFLKILINVKADRVKYGARQLYHVLRVGQAWCKDSRGESTTNHRQCLVAVTQLITHLTTEWR